MPTARPLRSTAAKTLLATVSSLLTATACAAGPDWLARAGAASALDAIDSGITAIVFSADGRELIVDTEAPSLFVLDAASAKPLRAPLASYRPDSSLSAPAGAGTRVFVAAWVGPKSGTLQALDAATHAARKLAAFGKEPTRIVASADGSRVALAYADNTVQVFDTARGTSTFGPAKLVSPKPVMGTALDRVTALALSADGSRLAVAVEDATVRIVDAATGKPVVDLDHGDFQGVSFVHGPAKVMAFSRDGRRLVAFEQGGNLALNDAASGKPLGPSLQTRTALTALAFAPDAKTAYSGDAEGRLQRWSFSAP